MAILKEMQREIGKREKIIINVVIKTIFQFFSKIEQKIVTFKLKTYVIYIKLDKFHFAAPIFLLFLPTFFHSGNL
jgi:hypothetical protein